MELNVAISVFVLFPVALALVAGGLVLYRGNTRAGWRAAGMGAVALGVGVLVVFSLALPVFQSSDGETPEPVVITGLVADQPTGGATTVHAPSAPASSGMMIPRPNTVEDLLARSQVIVLGTINSVLAEKLIYFGEDGMPVAADEESGLPFTDYDVRVESVLKGDGVIENGGVLVLRMFGHLSNPGAIITPNVFFLPNVGDSLLFALGENPDGTYGSGPGGPPECRWRESGLRQWHPIRDRGIAR